MRAEDDRYAEIEISMANGLSARGMRDRADGKIYVSVSALCRSLNVDFASQLARLKRFSWADVRLIRMRGLDGKRRKMAAIPSTSVDKWLSLMRDPDRSHHPDRSGKIYFVLSPSNNLVKIGFAVHVSSRLSTIRSASPVPLELLGCIPGTLAGETNFHLTFAHLRDHGEWFRAEPVLMRRIRGLIRLRGNSKN